MGNKQTEKDSSMYPDVLVKIDGGLYALNSRFIISIMNLPKYNRIPGAPEHVLGVIDFRGDAIPVLDMRSLFEMPTLKQEYEEFTAMLEQRKQDHIHWVNTLEECMKNDKKFTLATDPHKCAFGKWYDNFESDNHMINFHMKKIEEPHRKLHEAALEVERCNQLHDECKRPKCLKVIMEEVENDYMPQILGILDEAKQLFQSAFNEMVIVLNNEDRQIGIVVDEVLVVENLEKDAESIICRHSDYIKGVKQRETSGELVLCLDDAMLFRDADMISQL